MDWVILLSITGVIVTMISISIGAVQIRQAMGKAKKHLRSEETMQTEFEDSPEDIALASTTVRDNLPPRGSFIGRLDKKEELYDALGSNIHLIIVEGAPGIGKTSLALEAAFRCLDESLAADYPIEHDFNTFVWMTAKAAALTLEQVLDVIARTFDYPYITQLEIAQKRHEVIKLLKANPTLIIIDNFETITDETVFRFVESISEPSKVLITTRYQRHWNVEYKPISLDKLQLVEALELIAGEAKRLELASLGDANRNLLEDLYEATGGSPLAIKWSIGQIQQRGQSLTSVLRRIKAAKGDLFENMFAASSELLSPISKQILLAMPLFAATVSKKALEATTKIRSSEFDEGLGQLVELWLIEPNRELIEERQRFSTHPLTRAFITQQLQTNPKLEASTQLRATKYYLQFCNERQYFQMGSIGYDEIEAEVPNILRILEHLYDGCAVQQPNRAFCGFVVRFSEAINVFFWSRGYWGERISLCQKALEASKLLNDWASAGKQAYFIGIVRFWQGAVDEAESWALESKAFMERVSDPIAMALTERLNGLVQIGQGNYDQARITLKTVLDIISQPGACTNEELALFADWVCPGQEGHKVGLVALMQELGIASNRASDYLTAVRWLEDSKVLAQQINDVEGLSISFSHLGYAMFRLGRFEEAKAAYKQGLELAIRVQRKSTMGRCNQGLAYVAFAEAQVVAASQYGTEAINLFERLGMVKEKEDVEGLLTLSRHMPLLEKLRRWVFGLLKALT